MSVAFWWTQLGGPPPRRPALDGPRAVDVCIVGGGYTGLWTALHLKRAKPSLEIVVLEREHAGFGASGRNGGWLSGLLAGSRERWAARHGREAVIAAQREMFRTVDLVLEEGIECDALKGGSLSVGFNAPQVARLDEELRYERSWGFGEEDWRRLGAHEIEPRLEGARAALFTPHCARVQPARLVRGLAERVEALGVPILEGTPVTSIAPHRAETPFGAVRADWVVRATEGYTAGLPGHKRTMLPMRSSMIATQPIAEDLGWTKGETILDGAHAYCYMQRTADGRVAIGGRGTPYHYGSRTDRAGEISPATVAQLRARLERLIGHVEVAHAWSGVLGVPRDWSPSVGARNGIAWAGGYVGDGVSTAHLAGRTLRDLILGEDTELTRLPWIGHRAPLWEPEPLRWAAVKGIYAAYRRADRAEEQTDRPSRIANVAGWVSGR